MNILSLIKKLLAPVFFVFLLILKFGKFLFPLLKFGKFGSLLNMLASIWVYSNFFGWPFAAGFVLLIFVHECGHALAMKREGIPFSLPVFVPFMGAVIAMKSMPRNAWVEAKVGIGGPLLGALGASVVLLFAVVAPEPWPLFLALAQSAFMINLFNMLPLSPMDGGRIVGAVSKWFLLVGFAIGVYAYWVLRAPMLLLILLMGAFQIWSLFKNPISGYYEIPKSQRMNMGLSYVLLLAFLIWGHSYSSSLLTSFSTQQESALNFATGLAVLSQINFKDLINSTQRKHFLG